MNPTQPDATTTVTAIIPHWNRRDLLAALLENLRHQTRPFDQVIVVDNGSTDGSPEVADSFGVMVIRLDRNQGFAAAVNRGVQAADSTWVAILNNDVTLDPLWLEQLLQSVQSKQVLFATGKILSASRPGTIDGTYDEISRAGCALRCGAGSPDAPMWSVFKQIRIASMTAALFQRDLWFHLGGLDEAFGSYLEDVDFGIRCALAGHRGAYVPTAVAHHLGSATLGQWNKDTVYRIARNQILLVIKYFQGQSRIRIVAGQLLWGLVALRHGQLWPYLRGKMAGWRDAGLVNTADSDPGAVRRLLEESEKEIFAVQQQTGFDTYWRVYFWLFRPSS